MRHKENRTKKDREREKQARKDAKAARREQLKRGETMQREERILPTDRAKLGYYPLAESCID